MAVPLLPAHLMGDMYNELLEKTFRFRDWSKHRPFDKFKRYMRNYWASKDFAELSVFGLERKTNNNCESFHNQFNSLVATKHPNPFDFADCTNEMLENYRNEFEKLLANPEQPIVRSRKPALEAGFAKLKQEERLLMRGDLTPMQFLELNIHSAEGYIGKHYYGRIIC